MSILDVHADDIRKAFDYSMRAPTPDEPPASFQLGSFLGAGFKSLGRAGLETAGNFADLAALQQQGDINAIKSSDATDEVKAANIAERQRMAASFSGFGAAVRQRSAEMAPDPITAHRADQVISQVGTGVFRAVGAIGTTGPVVGSAIFGAGEAATTYQDAIDSGHDPATAAKLAATTGIISGLTAGLPAGGSTIARTVGLATAAGPASYVAQEAISKKILQAGGYADEAQMHDPTDPLGLALSIALPGVMGGLHIRALVKQKSLADVALALESNGKRNGPDGKLLTSSAGAQGEMQVLPTTATDPGFGVRPAALGPDGKPTPDELARVGVDYIAAMQQRYDGDPAKALAAYNAGPGTLDAAIAKHGDDWLAHMPDETQKYVAKGIKQVGDHAIEHAAADPATVDAARVRAASDALNTHLPDHPEAADAVQRAADAVSSGERPDVSPTYEAPAPEDVQQVLRDVAKEAGIDLHEPPLWNEATGAVATMNPGARPHFSAADSQITLPAAPPKEFAQVFKGSREDVLAHEIGHSLASKFGVTGSFGGSSFKPLRDEMRAASKDFRPEVWSAHPNHAGKHQEMLADSLAVWLTHPERRAQMPELNKFLGGQLARYEPITVGLHPRDVRNVESEREQPGATSKGPAPDLFQPRVPGTRDAQPKFEPAAPKPQAPGAEPKQGEPRMVAAAPESLEAQRADALIADNPELKVQLPGGTETVHAGEALAQARAEAEHDRGFSELIRAAVQCALTFGN